MESDIKRQELTKLWTWLCGATDEPEAFEALLDNFEGRYREVAQYVEERLQAELPERWRWLVPLVDHAAVGDRWTSLGMLVVLEANVVIVDDEPLRADKAAGVFIFRGKG